MAALEVVAYQKIAYVPVEKVMIGTTGDVDSLARRKEHCITLPAALATPLLFIQYCRHSPSARFTAREICA